MVTPYLARIGDGSSVGSLRSRPRARFEPARRLPIDGVAFDSPQPEPGSQPEPGPGVEPAIVELHETVEPPASPASGPIPTPSGELPATPTPARGPEREREQEWRGPTTPTASRPAAARAFQAPPADVTVPSSPPLGTAADQSGRRAESGVQSPRTPEPRAAPRPESEPTHAAPRPPAPLVPLPPLELGPPRPMIATTSAPGEPRAPALAAAEPAGPGVPGVAPTPATALTPAVAQTPGVAPPPAIAQAPPPVAVSPPAAVMPALAIPGPRARAGMAGEPTEITVTIGRIEVHAPAPAQVTPPPARGPRRRPPTLQDYLNARAGGRVG